MSSNVMIFGICSLVLGVSVVFTSVDVRLPGNHQGYAPKQPIAFSHRLHAGEMGMECLYCHFGAESSRHAGVPPASLCMNCHQEVVAGLDEVLAEQALAKEEGRDPEVAVSSELSKLYAALGLDGDRERIPGAEVTPIEWLRVHNLPDFVYFDHRPHVARGIACETCHGPVRSMERMRQESTLSMGWCLDCHRESGVRQELLPGPDGAQPDPLRTPGHVSTDCATCHM